MRCCSKCQLMKPLTEFSKRSACRACLAEYLREYRHANSECLKAKQREKYKAMPDSWRAAENERNRARYAKNREAENERGRRYYEKNREAVIARQCAHQAANREAAAAQMRKWRKENPEKAKSAKIAYYTRMKVVPAWADQEAIVEIYRQAKFLRGIGVDCHVDHIVPIRGKLVSGLHVETNLQILLASENMRKSNKALA